MPKSSTKASIYFRTADRSGLRIQGIAACHVFCPMPCRSLSHITDGYADLRYGFRTLYDGAEAAVILRTEVLVTFTEYLKYEAPPGFRDELIHGEIVLSPSAKAKHQEICHRLERLLYKGVLRSFVVHRDTTLYVAGKEGPRPDVFVIRKERWEQACESELGYPEGVPELVIEVRSPSNSESDLEEEKRSIYCSDSRCLAYWIVNPEAKTVTVFYANSTQEVSKNVSIPVEIGGGSIPLAKIFS